MTTVKMPEILCPGCGIEAFIEITPNLKHYAKATCPACKRFIKWLGKPENEGVRTQTSAHSASSFGINYCEICGRTCLGRKEALGVHHKTPISEDGKDVRENILILCTPCHRMCRFLRTYLNEHLSHLHEGR